MKRIKVLMAIDTLQGGGAERMVATYARYLDRLRFDLHVCCLVQGGTYLETVKRWNVPVHVLGKRRPFDLRMMVRLMRLMHQGGFQIVHTHMFTANSWGRIGAVCTGIPVRIATEHNLDDWKGPVRRWIDRRLAPWSAKIIAVSEGVEAFYRDQIGIPAEKLVTIRNGVSEEFLEPVARSRESIRAELGLPLDAPVMVHVARLIPQKGCEVLLEAAKVAALRHPRLRLLMLGEGPLREALETQARRLGIGDLVIFAGFRKNVHEALWASDLFALASWREGLPVSLLEAMAASLPSVVTSVGGNSEVVVEGETGFLVPPGDAAEMAERMTQLLDDPMLRKRMGEAARRRIEVEFSAERMVRETEALYQRSLKELQG